MQSRARRVAALGRPGPRRRERPCRRELKPCAFSMPPPNNPSACVPGCSWFFSAWSGPTVERLASADPNTWSGWPQPLVLNRNALVPRSPRSCALLGAPCSSATFGAPMLLRHARAQPRSCAALGGAQACRAAERLRRSQGAALPALQRAGRLDAAKAEVVAGGGRLALAARAIHVPRAVLVSAEE